MLHGAGGQDHLDPRPRRGGDAREVDPVDAAGQLHVGEDHGHVGCAVAQEGERLLACLGLDDAQVRLFEDRRREAAHLRLVLDDERDRRIPGFLLRATHLRHLFDCWNQG
jgi:hypothetical protein